MRSAWASVSCPASLSVREQLPRHAAGLKFPYLAFLGQRHGAGGSFLFGGCERDCQRGEEHGEQCAFCGEAHDGGASHYPETRRSGRRMVVQWRGPRVPPPADDSGQALPRRIPRPSAPARKSFLRGNGGMDGLGIRKRHDAKVGKKRRTTESGEAHGWRRNKGNGCHEWTRDEQERGASRVVEGRAGNLTGVYLVGMGILSAH